MSFYGPYGYDRKKPFKVEKITPRIWLANFTNQYDMAMTFVRYSEYYECPNPEFRGQRFRLLDYMDWYSKTYGDGAFTYAKDWVGFNVPGKIISECYLKHNSDRMYANNNCDLNVYDEWMWNDIYMKCLKDDGDVYILGSVGKDNDTFLHELAHAMYATDPNYKFEQNQNINLMDEKDREAMKKTLIKIGYAEDDFIIKDETQAYMATGLPNEMKKKDVKAMQRYIVNFQTVFNKRNPLNNEAPVEENRACAT